MIELFFEFYFSNPDEFLAWYSALAYSDGAILRRLQWKRTRTSWEVLLSGETNVCCGLGSLIVRWDILVNKDLVGFFSVVLTDVRNTQSFFVPA